MPPETPAFEERLRDLAARVGADPPDPADEHARWALYARAAPVEEARPDLLWLVEREPDGALASAVVVRLLESVPQDLRPRCVAALPPGRTREYARVRARELAILEDLAAGAEVPDVGEWTPWLQLRAAAAARHRGVLEALAATGATRRIRHTARTTLRTLT